MGENFFNNFFGNNGSPFNAPPFNNGPGGHMGGGSNDVGGRGDGSKENDQVNNSRLYNILGIEKDVDEKAIRKAYLKRSTNGEYKHPDKGGDEEKFKELSQAYEILKDVQKRKEYDTYGEDIFDSNFEQKKNFHNQFSPFGFNNESQASNKRTIQKGPPTMFPFKLSLEELCKNTTKRIKITRRVVFKKNEENDNNPVRVPDDKLEQVWDSCVQCNGQGIVRHINEIRPGMVQQVQMPCQACNRTGYKLKDTHEILETNDIIEVFIEKGTTNGTKIKFKNKGNVAPGRIPGDLYIVIQEKSHNTYTRKENDLLIKKEITLDEALFGRKFFIQHPDGRVLDVNMDGVITLTDNLRSIEGGGMPIKGDTIYGKLCIVFIVKFPTYAQLNIHPTMKHKLQELLTSIPQYRNDIHQADFVPTQEQKEEAQPSTMTTIDINELGQRRQEHKNAHDSDDEDETHGGHPPQCRQM